MIQIYVEMNKNNVISGNIIPLRANNQTGFITNSIFKDKILVVTGESYETAITNDMMNCAKDILILDREQTGEGVFNSIEDLKTHLVPICDTEDILIVGGKTLYDAFISHAEIIYATKIDEYRNIWGQDVIEFPVFKNEFALDSVKDLPPLIFNGMLLQYEYNKYIRIKPSKLLK